MSLRRKLLHRVSIKHTSVIYYSTSFLLWPIPLIQLVSGFIHCYLQRSKAYQETLPAHTSNISIALHLKVQFWPPLGWQTTLCGRLPSPLYLKVYLHCIRHIVLKLWNIWLPFLSSLQTFYCLCKSIVALNHISVSFFHRFNNACFNSGIHV